MYFTIMYKYNLDMNNINMYDYILYTVWSD